MAFLRQDPSRILLAVLIFFGGVSTAVAAGYHKICPRLEGVSTCYPGALPTCNVTCSSPSVIEEMNKRNICEEIKLCNGMKCKGTVQPVCSGKCYTITPEVTKKLVSSGGNCISWGADTTTCTYTEAGPVCTTQHGECTSYSPVTYSCAVATVLNCVNDFVEEAPPVPDASCDCSCPVGSYRASPPVKCATPPVPEC